jgi:hypothetical protein
MGLFDHPLTKKLGYSFARALRQECDGIIREYEREHALTLGAGKPPLHGTPEPGMPPLAADLAHAAEIIPLKASDLDREIDQMRAEFNQIHGWLIFRFYNDGSHTYVTFGCCHPEHLALAGAVLTQEALIECHRAIPPDPID